MRPVGFYERFIRRSRTRESLERLGGRVPIRPKSYDFGYWFRRRQPLNLDQIASESQIRLELRSRGIKVEGWGTFLRGEG